VWTRKDIPRGCELFGDEELLFAADSKERIIHVIRMIDGERRGKRPLPQFPWALTAGRNVARASTSTANSVSQTVLSVLDVEANKMLFEGVYDRGSRLTAVEPHLLAVYEPTGEFQLIDIRTGKVVIAKSLDAFPAVQNIRADVAGDELFVAISTDVRLVNHRPIGASADYPPINGLVYAFSLKTGQPLWPAPAVLRERFWARSVPQQLPFLVFTERESQRGADGGSTKLRLLCLDKRTGESVYRNDDLPDTGGGQFRVRVDRGLTNETDQATPAVAIEMSALAVRLTPTDRPRPPAPPAQDDLVADREFSERGLPGVARQIGKALEDAQRSAQEAARRGRGANDRRDK
jgi:hypothetical protein